MPSSHNDIKNFGDCFGYELFALEDIRGINQSSLATRFQIVTLVGLKRPDVIMATKMGTWLQGLGISATNRGDGGGRFEKKFSDLMHKFGSASRLTVMSSARDKDFALHLSKMQRAMRARRCTDHQSSR